MNERKTDRKRALIARKDRLIKTTERKKERKHKSKKI